MKPRNHLKTFLTGAIVTFSFAAVGAGPIRDLNLSSCAQCSAAAAEEQCGGLAREIPLLGNAIESFKINNSNPPALAEQARNLEIRKSNCEKLVVKFCPTSCTSVELPRDFRDTYLASDEHKVRNPQTAQKYIERARADVRTATEDDNLKAMSPGDADPGMSNLSNDSTGGGEEGGSKAEKSSDFSKMAMPLMQMAMQMMQQQQQPPQQLSCSGPNPAPGCPPQHACFTNPSSLECKCGPYGPGGPECGRPQLAATERNTGSPREKELTPPPPSEMSTDDIQNLPEFRPSTITPTAKGGGGGGGGGLGNSPSSAAPPKKRTASTAAPKDLNAGARGFMSASGMKTSSGSGGKDGGAGDGKEKKQDPRQDPSLQGRTLHYGRMLQAGYEQVRRRAASNSRPLLTSQEVRPASDDIFKAVNEAYQNKTGTFLR